MTTYIIKVITESYYLVDSVDPVLAMSEFGTNDPYQVKEYIEAQDEQGNFLVSHWGIG